MSELTLLAPSEDTGCVHTAWHLLGVLSGSVAEQSQGL